MIKIEQGRGKKKLVTYNSLRKTEIISRRRGGRLIGSPRVPQDSELLRALYSALAQTAQLDPISGNWLIGIYDEIVALACVKQTLIDNYLLICFPITGGACDFFLLFMREYIYIYVLNEIPETCSPTSQLLNLLQFVVFFFVHVTFRDWHLVVNFCLIKMSFGDKILRSYT